MGSCYLTLNVKSCCNKSSLSHMILHGHVRPSMSTKGPSNQEETWGSCYFTLPNDVSSPGSCLGSGYSWYGWSPYDLGGLYTCTNMCLCPHAYLKTRACSTPPKAVGHQLWMPSPKHCTHSGHRVEIYKETRWQGRSPLGSPFSLTT